ncbi:hypothetical protein [Xenorhabdus cabanillasii]|uniref:hypothetical protein n=1 Tax=Xenorhabdus cabanillasii TaxID=351673 RepID=UPI000C055B62|nr:hypothetical protein [Xenorhabdus cabanillasii]PHM76616.1 hypothetical protein Xcab_02839 [Xenorhabdus cabanillasii JM26]
MFKKLLTVGALSSALIGGISTASAEGLCPEETIYPSGSGYIKAVVNPYNNFDREFTKYEPDFGKTITWYFEGPSYRCVYERTDHYAWAAQYRGVVK